LRNRLGVFYKNQGRYDLAESIFQECLTLQQEILGKSHPNTLTTMHNLAQLYHSKSQYQAAESLFKESLAYRETTLGRSHPDTLTVMDN
jgi:tetratricopeptide (TPR) repeat protein